MRRLLFALALLFPAALSAQQITVDTITIDVQGATVVVAVQYLGGTPVLVGDTLHFGLSATDEFGDPVGVTGEIFTADTTVVRFIEQHGDSAVAVAASKGQAIISARNLAVVQQVAIAWLDPDSMGAWTWPEEVAPVLTPGESVTFCAAVTYHDGTVGVGNTDACLLAYNNRVANRLWRATNHLAAAPPFATRRARVPLGVGRRG